MESKKSKIIVLNYFDIRENTRIINCFSRDFGKLDLSISLSGRNKTSNLMEVFSEHYVSVNLSNDISTLSESEIISSNYGIVKSTKKTLLANIVMEILSKVFPKLIPDEKIYDLTSSYLEHLSKGENENLLTIAYMLKLLGIMGYRTTFNFSEGELIKGRNYYYNIDEGSIFLKPQVQAPTAVLDYNQCVLIRNLLFAKFSEIPQSSFDDGYFLLKTLIKTIVSIFDISKLNSVSYLNSELGR